MRIGWRGFALIIAGLCLGGFLFAWSGLFNVAASSGHWALTEWFLHWTMRNSVRTHALGIDPPQLTDLALVHRGAGHYASGCAPCHGAPGEPQSLFAREMTPMPPRLMNRIHQWSKDHLFWVVKHGIKYTGMPAWVARRRDDEVWAMVAFLDRLPDMTPREYRRLTLGPEAAHARGEEQLTSVAAPLRKALFECARCHGGDGTGRDIGAFPILAGQSETYLYGSLKAYASGARYSGIMQPAVSGLEGRTLRALARHYARAEAAPAEVTGSTGPQRLRLGERIATRGAPKYGVPACIACHGPKDGPRRAAYPQLAGQHADYLAQQIRLLQQEARGGSPFEPVMQMIATRLSEPQIRAVTHFYASLARKKVALD